MCGIVGMVGVSAVNQRIYDALTVLQHRGQDAAGIMTAEAGELFMRKDSGLVRDVFQQKHMLKLRATSASATFATRPRARTALRTPSRSTSTRRTACASATTATSRTPANSPKSLVREDRRHLNTRSDSEVLLNVLASELERVGTPRVTPADISPPRMRCTAVAAAAMPSSSW